MGVCVSRIFATSMIMLCEKTKIDKVNSEKILQNDQAGLVKIIHLDVPVISHLRNS